MDNDEYKNFISYVVSEIVDKTKDASLYSEGDVYGAGYRAALYAVLHLVECQSQIWDLPARSIGLGDFSSDDWRREGISYWTNRQDANSPEE